jgi:hypothetical protein
MQFGIIFFLKKSDSRRQRDYVLIILLHPTERLKIVLLLGSLSNFEAQTYEKTCSTFPYHDVSFNPLA